MDKKFAAMGIALALAVGIIVGLLFAQFDGTNSDVSHEAENTASYETQMTQEICDYVENGIDEHMEELIMANVSYEYLEDSAYNNQENDFTGKA